MSASLHRVRGENRTSGRPVAARLLTAALLGGAPASCFAEATAFARWVDRPAVSSAPCEGVSLTAGNAVGLLAERAPGGVVHAAVLYRVGRATGRLALRLPVEDAARLSEAVAALLRGERVRPIRFERVRSPGGACEVRRVLG